jgi:hypothetical protein
MQDSNIKPHFCDLATARLYGRAGLKANLIEPRLMPFAQRKCDRRQPALGRTSLFASLSADGRVSA